MIDLQNSNISSDMDNLDVKISLYRAKDHPGVCEKFSIGHRALLEINDVDLGPIDKSWYHSEFVYLLVVESAINGEILGGSKLVIYNGKDNLPLQNLLIDDYPELNSLLSKFYSRGLVEISGLWNSRAVAGLGLGSEHLIRTSIAVCSFLPVATVITFCSPFVTRFASLYGFKPLDSFGINGSIPFPDERWMSTINYLDDINGMQSADAKERARIEELRRIPSSVQEYNDRGKSLRIQYSLAL